MRYEFFSSVLKVFQVKLYIDLKETQGDFIGEISGDSRQTE